MYSTLFKEVVYFIPKDEDGRTSVHMYTRREAHHVVRQMGLPPQRLALLSQQKDQGRF